MVEKKRAFLIDEDRTREENKEQAYLVEMADDGNTASLEIIIHHPYYLQEYAGLRKTTEQRTTPVQRVHKDLAKNIGKTLTSRLAFHYRTEIVFANNWLYATPASVKPYNNDYDHVPVLFSAYNAESEKDKDLKQIQTFAERVQKAHHLTHQQATVDFCPGRVACHAMTKVMQEAIALKAQETQTALLLLSKKDIVADIPRTIDHPPFSEPLYSDAALINNYLMLMVGENKKPYSKNTLNKFSKAIYGQRLPLGYYCL